MRACLAGVGIGMFTKASLVDELSHPDVVTILDDYVQATRDISFVWPKRRLVPARVRRVTDFLAAALASAIIRYRRSFEKPDKSLPSWVLVSYSIRI